MHDIKYVLVTAARNEAQYIEGVVKSVASQTMTPQKWVIVSDGSTDATDDIVSTYARKHPFIELLRLEPNEERNFGSKVNAIHVGRKNFSNVDYDYFGVVDADITFESDYFEKLFIKFSDNPKLGIAGGRVLDVVRGVPTKNISSLDSVAGPNQMFRRPCWEEIGGYLPLKIGGEDAAAEIMARMKNWEVRTFPEVTVLHHRPTGTGMWSGWSVRFFFGMEDYLLGYHPLFFLLKSIHRMRVKPYILGGFLMLFGYLFSYLSGKKKALPMDVVQYLRKEQMNKIKKKLKNLFQRMTLDEI